MATHRYDGARERELGAGLDLLGATIRAILTDNTEYGRAITVATNASPIQITTDAAHGLATGEYVAIFGVLGNTNANGRWRVTVVNSTQFTLDGSTGNAAYTSGGFMVDLTGNVYLSDVPSAARIAISPPLAGKAITRGAFTASATTLTGVAGDPAHSITLFIDTGVEGTSLLIAHFDEVTNMPTPTNPGTVNINWANPIFSV